MNRLKKSEQTRRADVRLAEDLKPRQFRTRSGPVYIMSAQLAARSLQQNYKKIRWCRRVRTQFKRQVQDLTNAGAEHRSALIHESRQTKGIMVLCPPGNETPIQISVGAEHRSALVHESRQMKGIMVLCPYIT